MNNILENLEMYETSAKMLKILEEALDRYCAVEFLREVKVRNVNEELITSLHNAAKHLSIASSRLASMDPSNDQSP